MIEYDKQALSDITVFNKYARYIPEFGRRETFEEIVRRNMDMHIEKYPFMHEQIQHYYENYVIPKKVLSSMRLS